MFIKLKKSIILFICLFVSFNTFSQRQSIGFYYGPSIGFNSVFSHNAENNNENMNGLLNFNYDFNQSFFDNLSVMNDGDLANFEAINGMVVGIKANLPIISGISIQPEIEYNQLDFNHIVKPDGLSLDFTIDPIWAVNNLKNVTLQGGLNPKFLLDSEDKMYDEAKKYLDAFKDVPYIFNLGHGIVPETDPEKLKKLINFVKNYK